LRPGSATIDDFRRLDLRVGRVIDTRVFAAARKPAYQLGYRLRSGWCAPLLGPASGDISRSGRARRPGGHLRGQLPGRIAGFLSEVLVLGGLPPDGRIPLLGIDPGASPGGPIG